MWHEALAGQDDAESLVKLMFGLRAFWDVRGHFAESRRWCDVGVTLAPRLPPALEARVWLHDASFGWRTGNRASALRALTLFRRRRPAGLHAADALTERIPRQPAAGVQQDAPHGIATAETLAALVAKAEA